MPDGPSLTELVIAATGVIVAIIAYRSSARTSQAEVFAALVEMINQSDEGMKAFNTHDEIMANTFALLDRLSVYALSNRKRPFLIGPRPYVYKFILREIAERVGVVMQFSSAEQTIEAIKLHSLQYQFLLSLMKKEKPYFKNIILAMNIHMASTKDKLIENKPTKIMYAKRKGCP